MYSIRPGIPEDEFCHRWKKVQSLMQRQDLDLLVAYADDRATYGPAHARWLADIPVHFEPVAILFSQKADPVLLCGPESDRYALLHGKIQHVYVLSEFTHPDEDYPYSDIRSFAQAAGDVFGDLSKIKRVGIAGQSLMSGELLSSLAKALPEASWFDVENAMCDLRAVKSPAEQEIIRYAYDIAQIGFDAAVDALEVGVTERQVAAEAEAAMRRAGAEGTGIDTIVASGPNSAPILARSTFRQVKQDDLVLLTVAPRYEGYHGAIGRPVLIGNPGQEIERVLDAAVRAQEACFEAMRPGVEGRDVEAIGRRIMQEAGLGKHFLYSGLHSLGVIEFEPPIFGPSSDAKLEQNMVVSVDIPVFNAPWGGLRVEDGFLITQIGAERLNHTPFYIRK